MFNNEIINYWVTLKILCTITFYGMYPIKIYQYLVIKKPINKHYMKIVLEALRA